MMITNKPRTLVGSPSILLDSLRIVAALTVFFGHGYDQWNYSIVGHLYSPLDNFGHASVVVFFVLSGYVIAHTTKRNHRSKSQYAVARLSRLYSVVLPAILLTAICQYLVLKNDPQLNTAYSRGSSWPRYIVSSLFCNELWFFSASPPINGPLWSLSYEFWYYVIFGAFFFVQEKSVKSFAIPVLLCLIAGPKILIMMPIWLAGNFAYQLQRPSLSYKRAWVFVFLTLFIAVMCIVLLPYIPHQVGTPPLFWAAQFVTDWITGIWISAALWLLPTDIQLIKKRENRRVKIFRQFADLTFPIYVLHTPLLVLWRSIFGTQLGNLNQMYIAVFAVLIICILFGLFLEKYRYVWTKVFFDMLLYIQKKTRLVKASFTTIS